MNSWHGINDVRVRLRCAVAAGILLLALGGVVRAATLAEYVERFNREDEELYTNAIPNAAALDFLQRNVPTLECPDAEIERTYYFRWWTFRKHLAATPDGFVVTEFLPKVNWSGKHNTINCPAGHHFREGRWLHDPRYLDDYAVFWFRKGGNPRAYSFWAADSICQRARVLGDFALAVDLLPDLVANYRAWEKSRLCADGLFWQIDDRDGMEVSIGGSGKRATINSYLYGDARAIAALARRAGNGAVEQEFTAKAETLRRLVNDKLWNAGDQFYETLPRSAAEIASSPGKARATAAPKGPGAAGEVRLVGVRELHGFTPWYFSLPEPGRGYEAAWKQLMDPRGFLAPCGPTTAEQRHPKFAVAYEGHECQWNGPSWPFSTAVTLTAMANVLHDYPQDAITARDYLEVLRIYARSHTRKKDDGSVVGWIDENLNPFTGDWISRTMLMKRREQKGGQDNQPRERGKDYNHSTFCDLAITGLMGLRPREDDVLEVHPLIPADTWDWCRLDHVLYHGRRLTIQWDRDGTKFQRGAGLRVFADGKLLAHRPGLERIETALPRPGL